MTHAVTRIISFLILAFFLALGNVSVIVFSCVLTAGIYLYDPPEDFSKLFRSIIRMKWFFLSILSVYVFINSAETDFAIPLLEGFKRILILIIMLLLVSWLINKTPRDQILSALIFLLTPLKYIGFPIKTLALRIELVFQNIDDVQTVVVRQKNKMSKDRKKIKEIGRAFSGVYFDILDKIETKPLDEIVVNIQAPASPLQWLLPAFLYLTLFMIHNYS